MTQQILPPSFFDRPALEVAENLLGKFLVREIDGEEISLMINEVEAYDGPSDLACHASKGYTERTAPLFGEAGFFYVYLCYGMHWMLNIVVGPKDYPAAILIRGGEICDPKRSDHPGSEIPGPGRLTKFLKIDKKLNQKPASKKSKLWFEDRGIPLSKKLVQTAPRIGVDYAGPIWSKKPYRFIIKSKPGFPKNKRL